MMMKNLCTRTIRNNNKLYLLFVRIIYITIFFLDKKSAYFIVSEWLASNGGIVGWGGGNRLSLGYLVSAHGACLFFVRKNTFRRGGWENSIIRFFSSVLSSVYCIIVIIYIFIFPYRAVREKKTYRNTIFRKFSFFVCFFSGGLP